MSAVIYTRASGVRFSGYHWHYAPEASVGVIPTNGGETLIFAAAAQHRFMRALRFDLAAGFREILRKAAPSVAAAVRGASLSPFRAFAGRVGFFRPAWGPGWALVGDAGYFKDPITAHGITDALRDAELLANAVTTGTDAALRRYERIRGELSARLFTITDEIASFAWRMSRLRTLHKFLSDEMAREVQHVVGSGAEGAAHGDAHGGARAPVQSDHRGLQPAAR
jgi:2-polyprenyl-6-methoxyphenol hydroxylase-like FAD-dependent oxidoreductase